MANDPKVWRGGTTDVPWLLLNEFDLLDSTGDEDVMNIALGMDATIIERQGLVSGWTRRDVGAKNVNTVQIDAFSSTAPLFAEIGDNVDWTVPFQGGDVVGDRCFFGYGPGSGYAMPMAVNDWFRANFTGSADGHIAHGYATTTGLQTETAATDGATELTLAAVGAAEKLVANLHVTAFTGTDYTVKVQSDDQHPFVSATDQITFTQGSAVGSQHGETTVGAITDTKYRFNLTTSGGITSITFALVIGIVSA